VKLSRQRELRERVKVDGVAQTLKKTTKGVPAVQMVYNELKELMLDPLLSGQCINLRLLSGAQAPFLYRIQNAETADQTDADYE
jgi:hypothetical protein